MNATTLTMLVHGCIALAIIGAVTALLALHDLSESTALSLYGVAIALVGGATAVHLAAQIPAPTDKGETT